MDREDRIDCMEAILKTVGEGMKVPFLVSNGVMINLREVRNVSKDGTIWYKDGSSSSVSVNITNVLELRDRIIYL